MSVATQHPFHPRRHTHLSAFRSLSSEGAFTTLFNLLLVSASASHFFSSFLQLSSFSHPSFFSSSSSSSPTHKPGIGSITAVASHAFFKVGCFLNARCLLLLRRGVFFRLCLPFVHGSPNWTNGITTVAKRRQRHAYRTHIRTIEGDANSSITRDTISKEERIEERKKKPREMFTSVFVFVFLSSDVHASWAWLFSVLFLSFFRCLSLNTISSLNSPTPGWFDRFNWCYAVFSTLIILITL